MYQFAFACSYYVYSLDYVFNDVSNSFIDGELNVECIHTIIGRLMLSYRYCKGM